jgi:hypothetical protein
VQDEPEGEFCLFEIQDDDAVWYACVCFKTPSLDRINWSTIKEPKHYVKLNIFRPDNDEEISLAIDNIRNAKDSLIELPYLIAN